MITLTIDGKQISVPEGTTIMKAAEQLHVYIPHLCYLEGLEADASCGLCVVEVEGERNLTRSCARLAAEGMKIKTNTPKIRRYRRMLVELLLANHPVDCFTCERNQTCELLKLSYELGVSNIHVDRAPVHRDIDDSSVAIVRDSSKCVLCGRCIQVCEKVQSVNAIDYINRGERMKVAPAAGLPLGSTQCVNCGQCIHVCPVGAIREQTCVDDVWEAIADPTKHVVVQEAPAVRVALGEDLGLSVGTLVTGRMHAVLRKLGFDAVFDTNFSADLTIMEEGSELVKRVTGNGILPQFTSCCPAWIKFAEHFYQELLPHISTCKSPQQMFGALTKTYYAEEAGIDPASIVSVSIMPCTAKKYEAQRPEMNDSGYRDVDYVLTTRELSRMIKQAGIDFANLPDEKQDDLMGVYTGAGTIFGVTGGVMEAALRSGYKLITGREVDRVDLEPVRGMEDIREATVDIDGLKLNVAIVYGLAAARKLIEEVKAGKSKYHFIEIMACPGGCVGGGGQPLGFSLSERAKRGDSLYAEDKALPLRRSHENPAIIKVYEDYLGEPLGHKSHKLLHTTYTPRHLDVLSYTSGTVIDKVLS